MEPPTAVRHDKFYFDEPDTAIFKVGNVLFRPHIFILRRYCGLFASLLEISGPPATLNDEDAIEIGDLKFSDGYSQEISSRQFELGLRVLYPDQLISWPPRGHKEWEVVLQLSQRWDSPHIRNLAISNVKTIDVPPIELITMALKYKVESWLPLVFPYLCKATKPLSEEIAELMAPELLTRLYSVREKFRMDFVHRLVQKNCSTESRRSCSFSDAKKTATLRKFMDHSEREILLGSIDDFMRWLRNSLCHECRSEHDQWSDEVDASLSARLYRLVR